MHTHIYAYTCAHSHLECIHLACMHTHAHSPYACTPCVHANVCAHAHTIVYMHMCMHTHIVCVHTHVHPPHVCTMALTQGEVGELWRRPEASGEQSTGAVEQARDPAEGGVPSPPVGPGSWPCPRPWPPSWPLPHSTSPQGGLGSPAETAAPALPADLPVYGAACAPRAGPHVVPSAFLICPIDGGCPCPG